MEKITGKVREGRGIGKKIGFPTINIFYKGDLRGVYAGQVFLNGKKYKAAVHLGPRPTFFDDEAVCEAFLIDFDEAVLAGAEVEIEIFEKIRDVKKFENLDALKYAISDDVEFVKSWYNSH